MSNVILRGFAGQATISDKSMRCNVRIMETTRVWTLLYIPDHLIYDLVVGRDFLEQEHVILVKRGKELIL